MEKIKLSPKTIIVIAVILTLTVGVMIYDMARNNDLLNSKKTFCNGELVKSTDAVDCE